MRRKRAFPMNNGQEHQHIHSNSQKNEKLENPESHQYQSHRHEITNLCARQEAEIINIHTIMTQLGDLAIGNRREFMELRVHLTYAFVISGLAEI
jgi:hypothetical protein